MVVMTNYEAMVRTAVDAGIDFIISGAGLPLRLPECAKEGVSLIPVISSGRALDLIIKTWHRKYNRNPSAVIVEGPLCGGHLAFTEEQLNEPEKLSLEVFT